MSDAAYQERQTPAPSSPWPLHRKIALGGVALWWVATQFEGRFGRLPLQQLGAFKAASGIAVVVLLAMLLQLSVLRLRGGVWPAGATRRHRALGSAMAFVLLIHAWGTQVTLLRVMTYALIGNIVVGTLHQGYVRAKLAQYPRWWSIVHTSLAVLVVGLVPLHIYFALMFH